MTIPCRHWVDCGIYRGGCCKIDAHPMPSYGVCMACSQYEGPPRDGMTQLLVHGIELPSSQRPRRTQVRTGNGGSRPLAFRSVREVEPIRQAGRRGTDVRTAVRSTSGPEICLRCGGIKTARHARGRRRVVAARPGDERRYLGDHVKNILEQVGIKYCPKWVPGSCDSRAQTLNGIHRSANRAGRYLAATIRQRRRTFT